MIFLLILFNCVAYISTNEFKNYYWRDYKGVIPPDAVLAGKTYTGLAIFIGVALNIDSGLTPGTILQNDIRLYYGYKGQQYIAMQDIQILCSPNPQCFVWQRVGQGNQPAKNFEGWIGAGHERNSPVSIGRTFKDGWVVIGKVLIEIPIIRSFNYAKDGRAHEDSENFEILTYDPRANVNYETNVIPVNYLNNCNDKKIKITINKVG